jgi:DNA-binding PadR family transcriptional regulator
MYELTILGQLMRHPAHGYLITKIINDIIGPYAKFSNGRLYPLLSKLEQSGLITLYTGTASVSQSDRQSRSYCITDAGKKRFHELMLDTTINPGEYQKLFQQKACCFDFLKPNERLHLIDHYLNYCQAHILHQTAEAEQMLQQSHGWAGWKEAYTQSVVGVMQHAIDQWQLEIHWAKRMRAQELGQATLIHTDSDRQLL